MQFSELKLDPKVLKAVEEAGYTQPTPIQEQAIPHALEGRDVLGIAQTGTGKTASFTLPMITHLAKGRARARMPRSLILCPTRELAAQVAENFETYGKYHKLTMALLIGGVNFANQDKLIDRGVDVLIATPGRLLDHFERGKLMLTGIQVMVVDEADRMLDMGFIPDIEKIFSLTPFTRQTLFFSATMPPEITRLTETFLSNPERVEVAKQSSASETITQGVCLFRASGRERADKEKRECLRALMKREGDKLTNAIIFCNRKRDVSILQKSLVKYDFNAGALHGDLDQSVRTATLNGFRDGSIKLLVASDVAARGLDIPAVSHVFNFDVPIHSEDYVHRIGRTGRAGREGTAITICQPHEKKYLDKIEELVGKEIPRVETPEIDTPKEEQSEERPRSRSRRSKNNDQSQDAESDTSSKRSNDNRGNNEERRSRGRGRGGRGNSGRDEQVVGMGDHMPAFLLIDIRPKKKAAAKTTKAEKEASEAEAAEAEIETDREDPAAA
ncbi:DEAD/DEAH box helicase [Rhodobacteraceae bacterium NNCM2]|nr:DEAD/DEAH box helicase [Coraliihabitans acroporae]